MRVLRSVFLVLVTAVISSFLTWAEINAHDEVGIGEAQQRKVAVHEIGHAVVSATLLGPSDVKSVTVYTALGIFKLYGVTEGYGQNRLQTAEDILKSASVSMGGRAADKIVNGAPTNGATGDLSDVNDKITRMHAVSGLGDSLVPVDPKDPPEAVRAAIARDVNRANACAEAIVSANQDLIKDLADRVMKIPAEHGKRTFTGEAFRAALKEHPLTPVSVSEGTSDPCAFGPAK